MLKSGNYFIRMGNLFVVTLQVVNKQLYNYE